MRVEAAERALLELATAFDRPYRAETLYLHVVIALMHRSRSLFQGFVQCAEGPAPVAGLALLRPLVEINILLRYLGQMPDVRPRLWIAERSRWSLAFVNDIKANKALRERFGDDLPTGEKLEEWREEVRQARELGELSGDPGVGSRGALVPGASTQVRLLNNDAVTEAYVFAYRRFSGDVHAGLVSFDVLQVDERDEGVVSLSDDVPEPHLRAARVLAVTSFASTIRVAGHATNVTITEAADRIRLTFLASKSDGSQEGREAV